MVRTSVEIRPVGTGDLAAICGQRRRMFAENDVAEATLDAMEDAFPRWLEPRLADGRYFGFLAESEGQVVGGVGLSLLEWPPHPLHPAEEMRGYVLNVFVEPEFRGRGLAVRLMDRAEEEFRSRGVTYVTLHASAMGRPVYLGLGWESTTEMGKTLGAL